MKRNLMRFFEAESFEKGYQQLYTALERKCFGSIPPTGSSVTASD